MTPGRLFRDDDHVQATVTLSDGGSARRSTDARSRLRAADALLLLLLLCVVAALLLPCLGRDGLSVWTDGWEWWVQPVIGAAAFGAPAVLLLRRDNRSVLGRWLAVVALLAASAGALAAWAWLALVGRPDTLPGGEATLWFASWLWFPGYFLLPTVLLMLAPDGRLPSPRWRPALWATVFAIAASTVEIAVTPYPTSGDLVIPQQPRTVLNPMHTAALHDGLGWTVFLLPLAVASALLAIVLRWRRARGVERQQLKVVTAGALTTVVLMVAAFSTPAPWFLAVASAALVPYPLALGVAALRYRLWDVDVVLRRSLVYAVVMLAIVAAYVVVIVTLGGLIGRTTGAPLVATTIVALGTAPFASRLQRVADRRLFGDRADPSATVARLAERWQTEGGAAPVVSLDDIAADISRSLRLPHVRVATAGGAAGEWGVAREPLSRVPLRHGDAVLGELIASAREPGRALTRRDEAALADLARYVAVVAQTLVLSADLRLSRERIVVAREEERRRLRRDLHDGLGPQLAAIALQLESVRDLADGPDTPAGELAERLREQVQGAVGDVRRIVDDLRPAALDDLGLPEALAQLAQRMSSERFAVSVEIGDLPALSAASEVAVLRIVSEAVTNAARHSRGTRCTVVVRAHNGLVDASVVDNGIGIGGVPQQGSRLGGRVGLGLASMRERAAELGGSCTFDSAPHGGVVVRVLLPADVRPVMQ